MLPVSHDSDRAKPVLTPYHDSMQIRPAASADVPLLLEFIRELAEFEKLSDRVEAEPGRLREHLFGSEPRCEAVIAEEERVPVGFALYFHNYSTFLARPGLYLEDLFVRPSHRGKGIGAALLRHLARVAIERGCGRLEWAVLDWNRRAIDFYKALGATPLDEWTVFRLDGRALDELASRED